MKEFKIKNGSRKLIGFVLTLISYNLVIGAVLLKATISVELSTFVFQLATGYGIIVGLFFGSNVLEHYAETKKPE